MPWNDVASGGFDRDQDPCRPRALQKAGYEDTLPNELRWVYKCIDPGTAKNGNPRNLYTTFEIDTFASAVEEVLKNGLPAASRTGA